MVRHVGIDDWSIRKRQTYGTIMVDLDTHRTVDLLPSRDESAVTTWLKGFPNLELVVRDGARFFRNAIDNASPDIIQVSDRFHYIKTITDYFRRAIIRVIPTRILSNKSLNQAEDKSVTTPLKKTAKSWQRKQPLIAQVVKTRNEGLSFAEIGRKFSLDYRTVKKYLKNDMNNHYLSRSVNQTLLPYAGEIRKLTRLGYTARRIYDRLVSEGYPREFRTFRQYKGQFLGKHSSFKTNSKITRHDIVSLLFQRHQSCQWNHDLASVLQRFPVVRKTLSLFFDFVILSESYDLVGLDTWLKAADSMNNSEISKACATIRRDYSAIQNSIIFREYSNGPVEGKNTKTKYIKRIMFGRCGFDVLRKKILLLNS